jgi:outer membrane protein OmpA-like peptidoglycan-associated protein
LGCVTREQREDKNKKIVDFGANNYDEEIRRQYDVLRVQVNGEELLYTPLEGRPEQPRGNIAIAPNMENTPAFSISEEFGAAFAFNSATLMPRYEEELIDIARQINALQDIRVRIEGYTDSIGSDVYNLDLSNRRAKAVADFLVRHGVDADIMSYIGYGEKMSVADNNTEEGRAKNRRVEIYVYPSLQ